MRDKVEERLEREKWKRRKQREKKTGSVLGREKCTYLNKIRYRGKKKLKERKILEDMDILRESKMGNKVRKPKRKIYLNISKKLNGQGQVPKCMCTYQQEK